MSLPQYESGNAAIVDEVMITNRNGEVLGELDTALVSVDPDWDIDRSGSKGQVTIEAHQGALQPNMWISPYRTIIPEVGEIIRYPRGHFKLGRPGTTYDDTRAFDTGDPAEHQQARGYDIINDIAAVVLQETFATPVGGNVMQDVRVLIKMATSGRLGPNLLTNGGFESLGANWGSVIFEGSTTGGANWVPAGHPAAEGQYSFSPQINANPQQGTNVYVSQLVSIPNGTQFMYCSGLSRKTIGMHGMQLRMGFRDAANVSYGDAYSWYGTDPTIVNQWHRHFIVAPVPQGATHVRVYTLIAITASGYGFVSRSSWDVIRVGTATAMPLPDGRFSLPPSADTATDRIQTTVGKSIGYDAINGDRLASISHHSSFTTSEGRITTAPLRDIGSATPKRVYRSGDLQMMPIVEIPPTGTDIPNHFPAIKESFQEGVLPLYAEAWNENPDDAFSVANTGQVISAQPIMVPDAVDVTKLQEVANAARDRHSTQEQIQLTILPDHELTVYDVIDIDDANMPAAQGKWAIEYIGSDGPLMVIHARRAIGGWS